MTISSIHFQKAEVEFAKKHNFRTEKKEPEYLLDTQYRKTNEYLDLHDPKELYQEQMELRKQNHCRGYAPQIKDVYWEAVVNLDEKHSLADVRKVADFIQQNYHIQTCSIALHHDEGYKDKDGTVKYNHHAHICFLTMDNGISTMRKIRSKELRQMQTDVAQLLGLERGKENSKATRLDHKQYREKAKELESAKLAVLVAVLEKVQPVLQNSVNEKEQLNSTVKKLQDKILSLKEQKAIVEAERKKYKDEGDHIASEYRKLQDLNKTLYTKDQLESELQKLRDEHALRLKNALDDNTVLKNKNTELQEKLDTKPKEVIKTVEKIVEKSIQVEVPQQLTASDIEDLPRVQELKKQNTELIKFNSTVLEVIKAMHSDFDINHPIDSLKKIYLNWKSRSQKPSIMPLERSITNKNTIERVEVLPDTKNRAMSILEQNTTIDKKYEIVIGNNACLMTAQDIRDWLTDYPEERDIIAKQLSEEDRAEVFPSPEQTDKLHGTVKPTQTTSSLRSKGFHR